ncbi:hypothetical protein [Arcobacter sp. FWKO B]|uniref:hypothetical protein n=1 Tax=Arcobacter sp. FWKO B TaxID=2593672 RepID=UPI0018A62CA3|nr:hypothetical protein [Arcobacter sp. FWKO B]QOG13036.1 hypothetical protein FWKOB_10200 [Arcobacter sp. FWKO B]
MSDDKEVDKLLVEIGTVIPLFHMVLKQNKEIIAINENLMDRIATQDIIESKEFHFIEEMRFAKIINRSLMYAIVTDHQMVLDVIGAAKEQNDKEVVDYWTLKLESNTSKF